MLFLLLGCAEPPCPLWYTDLDGDGYGVGDGVLSCAALPGRSQWDGDCDDGDRQLHPSGVDVPGDGIDQNCDGVDECQYAIPVDNPESVDCRRGQTFIVRANLDYWPGDCICQVDGFLYLETDDVPKLGPVWVGGSLHLGSHPDWPGATADFPWNGQGLERLQGVSMMVRANLAQDSSLGLRFIGEGIETRSNGDAVLILSDLEELHGRIDLSKVSVALPALVYTEEIEVSGPGPVLELPALEQVVSLILSGGTIEAPRLEEVDTLLVNSEGEAQRFQRLERAGVVELLNGNLDLPSLVQVETLTMEQGTLSAPALLRADSIHTPGSLYAPRLQTVRELTSLGDLLLPALESVDLLYTSASLEVQSLPQVGELTLAGGQIQGELQSVESAVITAMEQSRVTQLSVRELGSLQVLEGEVQIEGPDHVGVLDLSWQASLVLLRTQSANELRIYGTLTASALTDVDSISLWDLESQLPLLRSARSLSTRDCSAFPSLRTMPEYLDANCNFDLRGMTSIPSRVELSGTGHLLLPDPFPGSIRIDEPTYVPTFELQQLEGGYFHRGPAPHGLYIEEVQGNMYLDLRGYTLGSLAELGSVGKDLSYCTQLISDSTMDAWIDTLDIGGSVTNSCP